MIAKKQAKIYSRKRVSLEEVVPLEVPFSVQIDICSACNLKCKFCFHSDLQAIREANVKFGYMSMELFKKIIDDMKNSWGKNKIKKLRLFKVGEPLLNPHVCEMVRYAKEADIAECIEITTNGVLLEKKMNTGLIEAGLDILNVSINGINEAQYNDVCQADINFQQYRENIKDFYEKKQQCQLFLKYGDIGYTKEEKECFYKLFGDICDEIFVETISSSLWQDTNVSNQIPDLGVGTYGQPLVTKKVCPFIFTTMVVNDLGIVHLCCADWKSEYVLGDLNTQSISEIWNGNRHLLFQEKHLLFQKDSIKICRNCESLSANTLDNIDMYANEIYEKVKNLEDN